MRQDQVFARSSGTRGEIYLYGDIGPSFWSDNAITDQRVADSLREMKAGGVKNLDVYINSAGGNVFHGLAIYNSLRRFGEEVCVYVDGLAASIASIIAMAGSKITMGRGSMMMIHEPSTYVGGKSRAMRDAALKLEKIGEEMLAIYVSRTTGDSAEIKKLMAEETWMTSADALTRKFATHVGDEKEDEDDPEMRAMTSASPIMASYRNIPNHLRAVIARGATETAPGRNERESMDLNLITKSLGLASTATEADVISAIAELRQFRASAGAASVDLADLMVIAGAGTAAAARGVFLAWKQDHERVGALQADLDRAAAAQRTTRVQAAVDGAVRDGKIPPAMREFWLAEGARSPETLDAYIAQAPRLVGTPPVKEKEVDPTAGELPIREEDIEKMFVTAGISDPKEREAALVRLRKQNADLAKMGIKLAGPGPARVG